MFDFILNWLKESPHEKDSSTIAQAVRPSKKILCGCCRSAIKVQDGPNVSFELWKKFHEKNNQLKFKEANEQQNKFNSCQTSSGML